MSKRQRAKEGLEEKSKRQGVNYKGKGGKRQTLMLEAKGNIKEAKHKGHEANGLM